MLILSSHWRAASSFKTWLVPGAWDAARLPGIVSEAPALGALQLPPPPFLAAMLKVNSLPRHCHHPNRRIQSSSTNFSASFSASKWRGYSSYSAWHTGHFCLRGNTPGADHHHPHFVVDAQGTAHAKPTNSSPQHWGLETPILTLKDSIYSVLKRPCSSATCLSEDDDLIGGGEDGFRLQKWAQRAPTHRWRATLLATSSYPPASSSKHHYHKPLSRSLPVSTEVSKKRGRLARYNHQVAVSGYLFSATRRFCPAALLFWEGETRHIIRSW